MKLISTSLVLLCLGQIFTTRADQRHKASTRLLYQYPAGPIGWLENIAVRSNGQLLLTSISSPGYLHTFDPFSHNATPKLITGFDYPTTVGIVETTPDVFYILNANFSSATISVEQGSNSVWRVDFNNKPHDIKPEKVLQVPNANFFNGLTAFNDHTLLAADSELGVVWAIDVHAKKSWIAIDDPLMKPIQGQGYLEGINGLHISPLSRGPKKTLCFTNSQQSIFACVELDRAARPTGPAKILARPKAEDGFASINWDDFTYDRRGTAYIATEKGNSVQAVTAKGEGYVVAGGLNDTSLASPSAAAFGRTKRDRETLYVTTAGTAFFPIYVGGEEKKVGAQIVAVDCLG